MKISNPSRDRKEASDPVVINAISRLETEAPTHESALEDLPSMPAYSPDRMGRKNAPADSSSTVNAGIWINQRKAVVVKMTDEGEEVQTIRAGDGGPSSTTLPAVEHATADEARFYEQVSSRIHNAGTVLIFGPGKSKTRLKAHLQNVLPERSSVVIAPADQMTDQQITGQVRNYFKIAMPILPLV